VSRDDEALPRRTERWVEALTWHETLTEPDGLRLTSAVIREWQAWYSDPENRRLFEHLTRLVSDTRAHPHSGPSPSGHFAFHEYGPIVPIASRPSARMPRAVQRHWPSVVKRRPRLAMGVAVAAVAALAVMILQLPRAKIGTGRGDGSITYQTGTAGLKDVQLRDGSQITLGGSTELVVFFSSAARSVELIRGEAMFRVAHDPKWPFLVHAGDGVVRAVGTAFLVTRDSDRVVVTVTEGTVAVTARALPIGSLSSVLSRGAASIPLPSAIRVTSGERVSYRDSGAVAPVVRTDSDAATAWMRGRLIFDDEPLAYVIESVNRYFPQHITATGPAGRLRFSGVILDGDIEEWVQRLPAIIPVDVDERGSEICIRLHAAQSAAQRAPSDR
jgi:transmembrane sensor